MWAAIATIFTALLSFFQNRKKSDVQVVTQTANEAGNVSAKISRKTDEEIHAQIKRVEASIAVSTAELEHSDSLHAQNRIAADAVDSANDPV